MTDCKGIDSRNLPDDSWMFSPLCKSDVKLTPLSKFPASNVGYLSNQCQRCDAVFSNIVRILILNHKNCLMYMLHFHRRFGGTSAGVDIAISTVDVFK
jgi:hypothetical protein